MPCRQLQACALQAAREFERHSSPERPQTWSWSSIKQLVVLGLGSPEVSQPARVQMAFAQLLVALLLHDQNTAVLACDPVFSEVDHMLMQLTGWQVGLSSHLPACSGNDQWLQFDHAFPAGG